MNGLIDEIYSLGQGRHLVFLICQAAWQKGIVYGAWFNVFQPLEAILEEINRFLAKSPVKGGRALVQNYQGFYSLSIKSEEDLEEVHKKACFIAEYGRLGVKLAHYYGEDIDRTRQALKYDYEGEYESELDYTIHWFKHQYLKEIPVGLRTCIDYSKLQEELFPARYFSIENDGIKHIFSRHREDLSNLCVEIEPSQTEGSWGRT